MRDLEDLLCQIEQASSQVDKKTRARYSLAVAKFGYHVKDYIEFTGAVGRFAGFVAHGLDFSEDVSMRRSFGSNYFANVADYVNARWGSANDAFRVYQTQPSKFFEDLLSVCIRWQSHVQTSVPVNEFLGQYTHLTFDEQLAISNLFFSRAAEHLPKSLQTENPWVRLPKFGDALRSYASSASMK